MSDAFTPQATEHGRIHKIKTTSIQHTERRGEQRHRLRKPTEMTLYNNSKLYNALLIDLTFGGARLIVHAGTMNKIPSIYTGRKIECYISTACGRSKCRGTVQWMLRNENCLTWGITFIELSPDSNDPLRVAISENSINDRSEIIIAL